MISISPYQLQTLEYIKKKSLSLDKCFRCKMLFPQTKTFPKWIITNRSCKFSQCLSIKGRQYRGNIFFFIHRLATACGKEPDQIRKEKYIDGRVLRTSRIWSNVFVEDDLKILTGRKAVKEITTFQKHLYFFFMGLV